ncbi:ABC transporter permease [Collinsella intestinalis]|uniref:ABC transporter permease n=1 Tax=Collinsella intestinalis TaxID=147207 RepID=UPI0025A3433E|nr:ABC transporter permease [Collinsella intestinalis]MDM8164279.1 ABC transporter permease [Collinsella intestinalis]
MSARDLIHEALHALEANRGRSLLTILGIVIGIAAVIAMTSLIGGVRNSLVAGLGLNAARAVYISPSYQMTLDDLTDLRRLMPEYEEIVGSAYGYAQTTGADGSVDVGITGAEERFLTLTGAVSLASGRLFTAEDEATAARVMIIDRLGAQALFGSSDANVVGKSVSLGGRDYQIVGIDEGMPQTGGSGSTYITVYMPLSTVLADFGGGYEYLSQVIGFVREGADIDQVMSLTQERVGKLLDIPEDQVEDNVYVYSMKSEIDAMNGFMNAFSLIMGSVAGISLVVGGIGIMNMMLTNVTERIREIGVRRALGATRGDITRQFLMESATLCVTGGIIGTVMGYLVSWGLAIAVSAFGLMGALGGMGGDTAQITPTVSVEAVAIAVGLSIAIGVVFGFYPARRAAKLDPVSCLRHQ